MFDQSLLRLIKEKPNRRMSALMDQYTGLVYSTVKNRISGIVTEEDIEEIVSDVFVAFYNQVDKIDTDKGSLVSYLITIAKRKAVDKYRSCGKSSELHFESDDCFIEIPDGIDIENESGKNRFYACLIDEINALGEPDSTVIYRKFYYCESSKEIASVTGLTADNVRKRLQCSLRKLESKLKGVYYET